MITVFKYPLPMVDVCEISMPIGAEIIEVAVQHDLAFLWARVDSEARHEVRRFRVAGTGHDLIRDGHVAKTHHGSLMLHGGALVFHVFEAMPL